MHILVIFTGGTIGSSVVDGWISPDKSTKSELIFKYQEKEQDKTTRFSTLSPYTVLSENLSATEMNKLIACVQEAETKDYDGIIVTHGTDTLQYSAATLAYTVSGNIPVVLVSADYPLQDNRSNGLDNFRASINFLSARPQSGVYVSYKNRHDTLTNIHLATRITSHMEACADVYSIDGTPYATVNNDTKQVTINQSVTVVSVAGIEKVAFCEKPNILIADSYPEKRYSYNLDRYSAVILSPYHSGTLNTASKNFQDFCLRAKEKGVPVFVVNVQEGTAYNSSKLFEDLGIIPLPFCTRISIFVKCWLALSTEKDIKSFVLAPLANEFCK